MRLSALFIRLGVFAIAAVLAGLSARVLVVVVQDRSAAAVHAALIDQGQSWTSVVADGLQVIIEGTAPSEAVRFRAISIAGSVVDASRVIDNMTVIDPAGIAPPDFSIEILRNDSGVSLIGLIPAATDRDALNTRIAEIAGGAPVTDLMDAADYPVPDTWRAALTYALRALEDLPRSKISVNASRVTVNAIADSPEQKRQLEAALARQTPSGVRVAVTITAPRPVITPFTARFSLGPDGARFDACAADTDEAERKIVAAAVDAGLKGKANCILALGTPSRTWGDAVALSIKAVKDLGGGTVTLTDADVSLVALEGTDQALFDRVAGELQNALPDLFALTATLPKPPEATSEGPPQFSATLTPEGAVTVRGRVGDDLINTTVANYAAAKFGQEHLTMGTRVVEGLPQGWSIRILAGLDALSKLSDGSVLVQPDLITVTGHTGSQSAGAEISQLLVDKVGPSQEFKINVSYEESLDPLASLPTPQECAAAVQNVTKDRKITFDPGSATLTSDSQQIVADIAAALDRCDDLPMQIAGYTDSQGREEMNLQLSQDRADAVLSALRARRVSVKNFTAVGFGEANPIADNDTDAGREANRRIEFKLIEPEPAVDPAAADAGSGDTGGGDAGGVAIEGAPADGAAPTGGTDAGVFVDGAIPPPTPDGQTDQGSGD